MSYFESVGFQKDFNNLLKSLLLISKKLEELTQEVRLLRQPSESVPEKEQTTE